MFGGGEGGREGRKGRKGMGNERCDIFLGDKACWYGRE